MLTAITKAPQSFMMLKMREPVDPLAYGILNRGTYFNTSEPLTPSEVEFLEALTVRAGSDFRPNQCYHNSQYVILHNQNFLDIESMKLEYYEGCVLNDKWIIPVNHGWLVLNGKIVDLTLTQELYEVPIRGLENRIVGEVPTAMVYVGIAIDPKDVLERISASGETHTILDDFQARFSHLKSKYIPTPFELRRLLRDKKQARKNGNSLCAEKASALISALTQYSDDLLKDLDIELSKFEDFNLKFYQNPEVARELDLGPNAFFSDIVYSARNLLDNISEIPSAEKRQDSLGHFVEVLQKCGILRDIIPMFYGADFIEEYTETFYFVHFTETADACTSITEHGFHGTVAPEQLLSTHKGRHADQISEDGYVYAYALKGVTSKEEAQAEVRQMYSAEVFDYESMKKCLLPHAVIGVASRGIEIYHKLDEETQTIIPAPCIKTASLYVYEK